MIHPAGLQEGGVEIAAAEAKSADYVEDLSASLYLPIDPRSNGQFNWQYYFGPNHYQTLKKLEGKLAEEGYEVAAFDNGRDALDSLPNVVPDLVLLDLIMPGLDGLTVLQRIRAADPRLPVVVLTAMDDPAVAVAARELGAVGVFRKDSSDTAPYRTVVTRVRRLILETLESHAQLAAAG